MLCAAAALGHAGHVGLAHMQLALVDWVLDMNMPVVDADPYRTRTEIGSLGRLKKYDAIVRRVLRNCGLTRSLHGVRRTASHAAVSSTAGLTSS